MPRHDTGACCHQGTLALLPRQVMATAFPQEGCYNGDLNLSSPHGGCQLVSQDVSEPNTGGPVVASPAPGFIGGKSLPACACIAPDHAITYITSSVHPHLCSRGAWTAHERPCGRCGMLPPRLRTAPTAIPPLPPVLCPLSQGDPSFTRRPQSRAMMDTRGWGTGSGDHSARPPAWKLEASHLVHSCCSLVFDACTGVKAWWERLAISGPP